MISLQTQMSSVVYIRRVSQSGQTLMQDITTSTNNAQPEVWEQSYRLTIPTD